VSARGLLRKYEWRKLSETRVAESSFFSVKVEDAGGNDGNDGIVRVCGMQEISK